MRGRHRTWPSRSVTKQDCARICTASSSPHTDFLFRSQQVTHSILPEVQTDTELRLHTSPGRAVTLPNTTRYRRHRAQPATTLHSLGDTMIVFLYGHPIRNGVGPCAEFPCRTSRNERGRHAGFRATSATRCHQRILRDILWALSHGFFRCLASQRSLVFELGASYSGPPASGWLKAAP